MALIGRLLAQPHGSFTPAWFSCSPTHCLRRFERSDYGCKGVSLCILHVVACGLLYPPCGAGVCRSVIGVPRKVIRLCGEMRSGVANELSCETRKGTIRSLLRRFHGAPAARLGTKGTYPVCLYCVAVILRRFLCKGAITRPMDKPAAERGTLPDSSLNLE